MSLSKNISTWAFLFAAVCGLSSSSSQAAKSDLITLTDKGQSEYRVVISAEALAVEKYAAEELVKFVGEISGTELSIVTDAEKVGEFEILLGRNEHLKKLAVDIDFDRLGKEGFVIRTSGKNIIIAGNAGRGTMYGVYTFLEDYLGCRWYSSKVSRIPWRRKITVGAINEVQVPVVDYREVYYADPMDPEFAGRLKLNGNASKMKDGQMTAERHAGWATWCHTSFTFVPPKEYFDKHPEYYSLLNGERKAAQLCFSNPDVLEITTEKIKKLIEQPVDFIPGANSLMPRKDGPVWADMEDIYFDVSQQDSGGACQCANCKALDDKHGSHIGSILTFINKLAERFPENTISTLSYQYTRKPPKGIRPGTNVSIMLCNIECARTVPIANSPFKQDQAFKDDIKRWSEICDKLFIWDYVVNFGNLLMPNPNFHIQQSNIKLFIDHNVRGIFAQGSREVGGEFCELRNYLLAKLLWNPDCDVDAVMDDFLEGYYGAAGKSIRRYIDVMREKVLSVNERVGIYEGPGSHSNGYLAREMLAMYNIIFDEAERAVADDDDELLHRVRTARMPLMYVQIVNRYGEPAERMQVLDEFYDLCKENGVRRLSEWGNSPDQFKSKYLGELHREVGVVISPRGGFYCDFDNVVVEMKTKQKNSEIRYTMDGSEPTEGSEVYGGPVSIEKACIVKAKCFGEGVISPVTASAEFRKGALPVQTAAMGRSDDAVYMKLPVSGVKTLKLIVDDNGGNSNDHGDWADAKLIDGDGNVTYLSDMKPVRESQGWSKLGIDKSISGKELRIGNRSFSKGLGAHAKSEIVYDIGGKFKYFETYVGVDAAANDSANIIFKVGTE